MGKFDSEGNWKEEASLLDIVTSNEFKCYMFGALVSGALVWIALTFFI